MSVNEILLDIMKENAMRNPNSRTQQCRVSFPKSEQCLMTLNKKHALQGAIS